MSALAVVGGPALSLAAAIRRAAAGALVSGGITSRFQLPVVWDSSMILWGSSSVVNQPALTT
ncbi:hypothetical protein [Streptomyces mirabilis]|uniref:hypothetical protein n=1 Tax=Streptomyces mirabilis TaxID=68239 RepID=UPI00352C1386